jgi:hypothetical protein|nr:MAG TPA: hypothetical protein [Caudoviricetes sp.]
MGNKTIINIEECRRCKFCRRISTGTGWSFLGCFHYPLRGKILREIEICPKIELNNSQQISNEK